MNTEEASPASPVDLIVGQQKATHAVVCAAFEFWMNAKTTAQREIQKLRQLCPHECKEVTTRSDETDQNILTVHCSDYGKWVGGPMKCEACGKQATSKDQVHVVAGSDTAETWDYRLICGECIAEPEKWVPDDWPQVVDNVSRVWWTRT